MKLMRELMEECSYSTQSRVSDILGGINQKPFDSHAWQKSPVAEGGIANIFTNGALIEKGCVNAFTICGEVFGEMRKILSMDQQQDPEKKFKYFVTGIITILHPSSPMVPTLDASFQYFEIVDENNQIVSWFFGAGANLTPCYLFEEDVMYFHHTLKKVCDKSEIGLYEKLKKNADEYFYLPHREEHLGVGGIHTLRLEERPPEDIYQWIVDFSNAFPETYFSIATKHMQEPFTELQKKWQLIRRGRCVEFNLLFDSGARFGLKSDGNVENILMTLPPQVCWEYNYQTEPGSEEEKMVKVLKSPPRTWV